MTVNPAYSVRGSHVHAEHPNELCNLLNGFDAEGGYANRSAWEVLLPEFETYLEWLLANGQNLVEWSLLSAKSFSRYQTSAERASRLTTLVAIAKERSLRVGVDATFTQKQEHGWRLWRAEHETEDED